jgi:predicted aspartyl protease
MEHGAPVTQATINKHPVRLSIDSGAFYSIVSTEVARAAGLSIKAIPADIEVRWGGVLMPAGRAFIDELKLGGSPVIKSVNFIVGGTYDGVDGVIGQNLLGRRDVEYDLEHGVVRLAYAENCLGQSPVYWAAAPSVMSIPIEPIEGLDQRTLGTVLVNGVKMRALFASKASMPAISLRGLKKLGLAPSGDDVDKDEDGGANRRMKLDTVDIGGETLHGGTFRIIDLGSSDIDMVIGLDFFMAHRIYVGNGMRRLYFTYGKGPVFGVLPAQTNIVTGQATVAAQ